MSKLISASIIEPVNSSVIAYVNRQKFSNYERLYVYFQSGAIYLYSSQTYELFWSDIEITLERGESIGRYFNKVKSSLGDSIRIK